MVMLAEYGTMSLEDILQPSIEMAKGYPIEAQAANSIERNIEEIKKWPYSKNVFLTNQDEERESPNEGEIFIQKDLLFLKFTLPHYCFGLMINLMVTKKLKNFYLRQCPVASR